MSRLKPTTDRFAEVRSAMDAWGDTVLRLAQCRCRNRADADDVFQTVFLKLFQNKKPLQDPEHVKAWLLRVTLTSCSDLYRSSWETTRAALDEGMFAAAPEVEVPFDLDAAIAKLPERQRVCIHLFYYEGYQTDEIAEITGENHSTVRSHLRRAREALKITLGEADA